MKESGDLKELGGWYYTWDLSPAEKEDNNLRHKGVYIPGYRVDSKIKSITLRRYKPTDTQGSEVISLSISTEPDQFCQFQELLTKEGFTITDTSLPTHVFFRKKAIHLKLWLKIETFKKSQTQNKTVYMGFYRLLGISMAYQD